MSQQYPQQQQQPLPQYGPPKQKHTARTVMLVLLGLALLGAVGISAGQAGKSAQSGATLTTHQVWYRADGVGTTEATYTLQSDNGGTVQGDVSLPLRNQRGETGLTFTGFKPGDFVYLSVQNTSGSGSVTCRIFVDGVEISSNTSDGAYVIATCSSRVPWHTSAS